MIEITPELRKLLTSEPVEKPKGDISALTKGLSRLKLPQTIIPLLAISTDHYVELWQNELTAGTMKKQLQKLHKEALNFYRFMRSISPELYPGAFRWDRVPDSIKKESFDHVDQGWPVGPPLSEETIDEVVSSINTRQSRLTGILDRALPEEKMQLLLILLADLVEGTKYQSATLKPSKHSHRNYPRRWWASRLEWLLRGAGISFENKSFSTKDSGFSLLASVITALSEHYIRDVYGDKYCEQQPQRLIRETFSFPKQTKKV